MGLFEDTIRAARERRNRLYSPPNAVIDTGIDLKRPKKLPPILLKALQLKPADTDREVIHSFVEEPTQQPGTVALASIVAAVAEYFTIGVNDIRGPSRRNTHTLPRHIVCFLARKLTKLSTVQIGMLLGNRDHSTIIHAVRRIQWMVDNSHALHDPLRSICRQVLGDNHPALAHACFGQPIVAVEPGTCIQEQGVQGLDKPSINRVDEAASAAEDEAYTWTI